MVIGDILFCVLEYFFLGNKTQMLKDIQIKMITCLTKLSSPESNVVHSVVADGANNKAGLNKKGLKRRT